MAYKLKAIETTMQVGEMKGQNRYVLLTDNYNKLSDSKVIEEAAVRSGLSRGVIQASWDALGKVLTAWVVEGHSVPFPGVGTMRFGVRAKSVANVEDVATSLITTRRVIFTPSTEIKNELKETSIQITCYDKQGNIVKRVTSADDGTVEDETRGGSTDTSGDTSSDTSDSGTSGDFSGDTSDSSSDDDLGGGMV